MLANRLLLVGLERVQHERGGKFDRFLMGQSRPVVHGAGALFEKVASHREQPEPHPALDGPQRGPGPGRDLLLREPAEIGQLDRLALHIGQHVKRGANGVRIEARPRPRPTGREP